MQMKKWFKNKDGKVRSGWKVILAFVLMNLLTALLTVPIFIVIAFKDIHLLDSIDRLMADHIVNFFIMLAQLLGVVATLAICLKREKRKWRDIGLTSLSSQGKNLWFGFILGAVSILLVTLFMAATKQVTLLPANITPALKEKLPFLSLALCLLLPMRSFSSGDMSFLYQSKPISLP
jgi:hypothetical protein